MITMLKRHNIINMRTRPRKTSLTKIAATIIHIREEEVVEEEVVVTEAEVAEVDTGQAEAVVEVEANSLLTKKNIRKHNKNLINNHQLDLHIHSIIEESIKIGMHH
jgi:hypothetical protein